MDGESMKFGWTNRIRICVSGSETERFFNMASFHGLILYHVCRTSDGMEASVKAKDMKRLCSLRAKTGVSIHILEKRGPYFLWKKTRKRRVGLVCGVLSFVALYVMSLFVWDIDFAGNVRYTDSYLLSFVKKEGFCPGMRISDVVCDSLEKRLRNEFDDITWVSARLEGTRLVVEIEENNTATVKVQEEAPCSIRASKSGTIMQMVTRRGTPLVKKGDEVAAGDVLVSGYIPIYNDSQEIIAYEQTNASADVWIDYEETVEMKIPRSQMVRHYTSERVLPGLILFGHRFCLPGSLPIVRANSNETSNSGSANAPQENELQPKELNASQQELYIEQHQWKLFDNFYLPFYSEKYRLFSYETAQISYNDEQLKEQANQKYLEFIVQLEKLGVEIIENNVTIESEPDTYRMKVRFLLEENAVESGELEAQGQEKNFDQESQKQE